MSSRVFRVRKGRPARLAYCKSFLPVVMMFLVFVGGLTAYSFLGRLRSPAESRRLGWQAWEPIDVGSSSGDNAGVPASLPLDIWDPMAPHTTGLTELAVTACFFPPYRFPEYCRPRTTPEDDRDRGQWVLVGPDLNKGIGYKYLNVWYRRTRRQDVPRITQLRVAPDPPPADADLAGWVRAEGDLHAATLPRLPVRRLWYKTEAAEEEEQEVITEVSVHYGDNDPFFGFTRVLGGKVTEGKTSVDLIYRRGNPVPPAAGQLEFHADGTFKIMQIADLHYSVGVGACRDTNLACAGDNTTAAWLAEALDTEHPDLVVFSGDQLNGQGTTWDPHSVLAKFAAPVIARRIPWAAVFGNHDSEDRGDRAGQMAALARMPYSLSRAGPADVDGVGNYDLRIYSGEASNTHVFTLYFLDSHAYTKSVSPLSWINHEYDHIKSSQIQWYRTVSAGIAPIPRPFHPASADSDSRRRAPARLDPRDSAKPNAIMFFHIPLAEAYEPGDKAPAGDELYPAGVLELGVQLDRAGNAKENGGLFAQGIQKALEADAEAGGGAGPTEVKVLSHGHCHNTDRCRRVSGVWMCFDGGSSYSGYGDTDFARRVRMYALSQWGETIESYKRLASGEVVDRQPLVGRDAAAGWGQGA